MKNRKLYTSLGLILILILSAIIIGVMYLAPTCQNEMQIAGRVLLVISIIVAFAIIRNKVKKTRNKQLNKN